MIADAIDFVSVDRFLHGIKIQGGELYLDDTATPRLKRGEMSVEEVAAAREYMTTHRSSVLYLLTLRTLQHYSLITTDECMTRAIDAWQRHLAPLETALLAGETDTVHQLIRQALSEAMPDVWQV